MWYILPSTYGYHLQLFTDLYHFFNEKKQWELRKDKHQFDHLVTEAQYSDALFVSEAILLLQ